MLRNVILYVIKHDAVFAQIISVIGVITAQCVAVYKIIEDRKQRKKDEKVKKETEDTTVRLTIDSTNMHMLNQAILEVANIAIVLCDENMHIFEWNDAACALFGWTSYQTIGMPITMLIPETVQHLHNAGVQRFIETGKSRTIGKTIGVQAMTHGGNMIDISLTLSAGKFVDGSGFFCGAMSPLVTLYDLSDGKMIYRSNVNHDTIEKDRGSIKDADISCDSWIDGLFDTN